MRHAGCIIQYPPTGVRSRLVNEIGKKELMFKRGLFMLCSAALLASSAWVHGGDSIQGDLYQYSAKSNESGSGMGDTSSGIYGGWSTLPSAGRTGLANSVTMSSTPPGMVSRTASSAAAGTMRIGSAERNSADQAHDMPTR